MQAGEVYASKPYASTVVMTIGPGDPSLDGYDRFQCLVLFDSSMSSLLGAGSIDYWMIFQLERYFERIA